MAGEWAGGRGVARDRAPIRAVAPRSRRGAPVYQTLRGGLADLARAPRPLPREGDARGQAQRRTGSSRTSSTRRACKQFCRGAARPRAVPRRVRRRRARATELGERIALAQTLLKLTSPGVPDIYQGDELWALALVDPDNRRPVDWAARRVALDALRGGAAPLRETAKLHLILAVLDLRRRRPEPFAGAYRRSARATTCARSCAATTSSWPSPCATAGVARRGRSPAAPKAHGATWSPGRSSSSPRVASAAGVLGPEGRAVLERLD